MENQSWRRSTLPQQISLVLDGTLADARGASG
jgi:hypothetical protein